MRNSAAHQSKAKRVLSIYWRYWMGSAALLNIAIGFGHVSLLAYQEALKQTAYAALFLTLCIALARYRRAALPFLPVAVALTFAFAIPLFGQSIAHAPGLLIGLLLLSAYMAAGIDRAAPAAQFIYLFSVGGVMMYFDLANGHLVAILISFALIRVISIRAFGSPEIPYPARLRSWTTSTAIVSLIAAYFMGAVSIALLRILLRAALLQQNISAVIVKWVSELSLLSQGCGAYNWTALGGSNSGISYAVQRMYHDIEVATYPYIGKHATMLLYAICGLVYLVIVGWMVRRARSLEAQRRDTVL